MALACSVTACERAAENPMPVEAKAVSSGAPTCGDTGFLATGLYGSIEREFRWDNSEMRCESMRRPDGEGIRLRFTGDVGSERIAIILAVPKLERGQTGSEYPTVVTFMVEGSGRFFSTPNLDNCWSDISRQEPVVDSADRYDLAGKLYCVAPLGEINGDAAVSMPELEFRGIVDWGAT